MRIGHGYDIHRIEPGSGLPLGGVFIDCDWRVIAHSDGDVAIHALCDALLGAIAAGDIGHLFPDTDPEFSGADSRQLLRVVVARVHEAGYRVGNVDVTIIAQVPRIAPHGLLMRQRLAEDLQVEPGCVSVKATTKEKLDAVGEKRGIEVHAVALLLPR